MNSSDHWSIPALPCVFGPCLAVVQVVSELRAPGSDERLGRIAEHAFRADGADADGQVCPASLMEWPLLSVAVAALAEQERSMLAADRTADSDLWFGSGKPREHSLEPHPDADPYWFRNSG